MSRNNRDWRPDCKVYIGDLGYGAGKQELEDAFSKYGPLKNVWVARNPPGFAFVEFEDPRDARDAVKAMDGARLNGRRVKVEMSTGRTRSNRGGGGRDRRRSPGGRYGGGGGGYGGGRRRSYSPRRSYSRSRSRSRSGSPRHRRSLSPR